MDISKLKDTYPITKKGWELLNKIHDRLDEMDKKGMNFFEHMINLKDKINKDNKNGG